MNDKLHEEKKDDPAPQTALDYEFANRAQRVTRAEFYAYLSLFFAVVDVPLILCAWIFDHVKISPQINYIIWRSLDIMVYCCPYVGFILGIFSVILAVRDRRYSLCLVGLLAILISWGFRAILSIQMNLN